MYRSAKASKRHRLPKRLWAILVALVAVLLIGTAVTWGYYNHNLQPVSSSTTTQYVTIASGSSADQIAVQLKNAGLIRSSQAFEWYVASHNDRNKLQAGTYKIAPDQNVGEIVNAFVLGKVATDLVTILPGARIEQVREAFIKSGFQPTAVDAALVASQYRGSYPALSDNPASSDLEGFLFPDSYQKTGNTDPKAIIEESLTEMQAHLTSDIRSAFAQQGLSTYQGVTLASIVEQEVSKPSDRAIVAQVFLKRLQIGMPLGSDVTANYGAIRAGQPASLDYDSPFNTLLHSGLPPGPISTISDSALAAVAHPASTAWLYFVTGDDGTTYFSSTLQDHEALTQKYCHKLCSVN